MRMRSTGGGSGLLYSLKSMVMSAGFRALRASMGARAWAALGWAMAPFKASWIGVTFRPLLRKQGELLIFSKWMILYKQRLC